MKTYLFSLVLFWLISTSDQRIYIYFFQYAQMIEKFAVRSFKKGITLKLHRRRVVEVSENGVTLSGGAKEHTVGIPEIHVSHHIRYTLFVSGLGVDRYLQFSDRESSARFETIVRTLKQRCSENVRDVLSKLVPGGLNSPIFGQLIGVEGLPNRGVDPFLVVTSPGSEKIINTTNVIRNKNDPIFTICHNGTFLLSPTDLEVAVIHGIRIACFDKQLAGKDTPCGDVFLKFEEIADSLGNRIVLPLTNSNKNIGKSTILLAVRFAQATVNDLRLFKAIDEDRNDAPKKVKKKHKTVSGQLSDISACSTNFVDLTGYRSTLSTSTAKDVDFGVVSVEILACSDLKNMDSGLFGNYTDAFACVCYGSNYAESDYVANSLNPVFPKDSMRAFRFPLHRFNTLLHIGIFDHDSGLDHDFIGRTSLNIALYEANVEQTITFGLFVGGQDANKEPNGYVTIRLLVAPTFGGIRGAVFSSFNLVVHKALERDAVTDFDETLRTRSKKANKTTATTTQGIDAATAATYSTSNMVALATELTNYARVVGETLLAMSFNLIFWRPGARYYSFTLLLTTLWMLNDVLARFFVYSFFVPFLALVALHRNGSGLSFSHVFALLFFARTDSDMKRINNFFERRDIVGDHRLSVEEAIEQQKRKEEEQKAKKEKIAIAQKYWQDALDAIGEVEEEEKTRPHKHFKIQLDPLALLLGKGFPYFQKFVCGVRICRNILRGDDVIFGFTLQLFLLCAMVLCWALPIFTIAQWGSRIATAAVLGPQNLYVYKRFVETGNLQRKIDYYLYCIIDEDDFELQKSHDAFIESSKKRVRVKNEQILQDESIRRAVQGKYAIEVNAFNNLRVQNYPLSVTTQN